MLIFVQVTTNPGGSQGGSDESKNDCDEYAVGHDGLLYCCWTGGANYQCPRVAGDAACSMRDNPCTLKVGEVGLGAGVV